jgi:hypothetical protein
MSHKYKANQDTNAEQQAKQRRSDAAEPTRFLPRSTPSSFSLESASLKLIRLSDLGIDIVQLGADCRLDLGQFSPSTDHSPDVGEP